MWSRASKHATMSMPSTTADASSQPRTGAPRFRATSSPSPRPRSRAPTMRAKRRVPPSDPSRPVIVRPTNPGARSDTTPMAILPPAKLIARFLPSIDRILRDQRSAATSPTASEDGPQPLSGRSAVPDSRLRDRNASPSRMRDARTHRSSRSRVLPAREPANERTEQEPGLRGQGDIGGDDADRQAHHGAKRDGGSDAHVRAWRFGG